MPVFLTLIVIALLTVLAWQDRAQLADEWAAIMRELGL